MNKGFPVSDPQPSSIKQSALIAMSGGVDSAAAAVMAMNGGYDCTGVYMRLCPGFETAEAGAREAAGRLGIPLYVCDFTEAFAQRVIARFISEYREGRTPNPCVDCNKHIKFGHLLEYARGLGADCLMTGHYARVERGNGGRYILKKGADSSKDQSYFLYALKQDQLAMVHFPLGGSTKRRAREIAQGAGLDMASYRESQDICFIPGGDLPGFITRYTGEPPRKGRFVDTDGNDLGENKGLSYYTIGQRRGLGLAMPYPPYVIDIRAGEGTVVIGGNELLYSKTLVARDINLIPTDKLGPSLKARVKIRYRHAEQPATITQTGEDTLHIEFDEPQRAITKGQAAVIYDGEVVIGGGTIV